MSTQSTPASLGEAPWKHLFLDHLSKLESPEFAFSSLQRSDDPHSPTPYVPRVRYCVYRGMWASIPENKHYDGPKNEKAYDSDLLTFTSDIRMAKIPQIFASSAGHGEVAQSQGSGGGGPVEAVFWVKDTMTQWRFKGEAFVVGEDIEGEGDDSSGVRTVKSKIGARMRIVDEEKKEAWSWATEVTHHFGNLSPGMRGSFKNPPPGTPISTPPTEKGVALGQKINDLDDKIARKNFRVVIIKPDEVEQLDLSIPDKARRWRYTYVGADEGHAGRKSDDAYEWKKEELWP